MLNIDRYWYRDTLPLLFYPLVPISALFACGVYFRRLLYQKKIINSVSANVPTIVVGNITVGGTGKTPSIIWLAEYLRSLGFSPGVVSRGVGGKRFHRPHLVDHQDSAKVVGDEALLLAKKGHCPVMVCVDRALAARALAEVHACDVLLSDDGLQHYRLARDVTIALVDAKRQMGNRYFIPAGPLRESPKRLRQFDFVIETGSFAKGKYIMQYMPLGFVRIVDNQMHSEQQLGKKVHAVAAIGHPEQFFTSLEKIGFEVLPHRFSDHYHFKPKDLKFEDDLPVIMTEKDAMKCARFAKKNFYFLQVSAQFNTNFIDDFTTLLKNLMERKYGDKINFSDDSVNASYDQRRSDGQN